MIWEDRGGETYGTHNGKTFKVYQSVMISRHSFRASRYGWAATMTGEEESYQILEGAATPDEAKGFCEFVARSYDVCRS